MRERDLEDALAFKFTLAGMISDLVDIAHEKGMIRNDDICSVIAAETLALAAMMHKGDDADFLAQARRALALVRTGAIEQ